MELKRDDEVREERWSLGKADWDTFRERSESRLLIIENNQTTEDLKKGISNIIIEATVEATLKNKPRNLNNIVPWWLKECILKRTHNFQRLIGYKR